MGASLRHDGNRHTLRFERRLPHPIEKVWRALTDSTELAHWFPADIRGERRAEAALRFVFPGKPGETPATSTGEGPVMEGKMLVFDPPNVLELDWAGEVLRFTLRADGAGTVLVFTHTFEDVEKSARDATGWEFCLESLESRLAGRTPAPFSPERFDPVFADYAKRFGPEASAKKRPEIGD